MRMRYSSRFKKNVESSQDDDKKNASPEPLPRFIEAADRAAANGDLIDLLNARPAEIVDKERQALSFAFAGGDTVGAIRGALDAAKTEPSRFDPACFKDSLFITDLIETCMKVKLSELTPHVNRVFLTKLLTYPPSDGATVSFRREILRELTEKPELLSMFQDTYRALYKLRDLFESEVKLYEIDNRQRRIDILTALKNVIVRMAEGFAACESGLSRISEFAARRREEDGFKRLVALLDIDNHLSGVDLRLRIGADGRVNRFEIVSMRENQANPFYRSPVSRFLMRLRMLFRGYVFSEGELVNRWVDAVYEGIEDMVPALVRLLGEMEFYLSTLAFKELSESKGLAVGFPDFIDSGTTGAVEMIGLFNPLLFEQDIVPVACDIQGDKWETITIVTGPNSGGKTRLLQAVAVAQIMGECGMFAPVKKAVLKRAAGLFVSLIEEARADQREGRLGTELIRIRNVFERSRPDSLVILDELCSGTNPSEGEEIFRLVVSLLSELRPRVFITTHFLQFAACLAGEAPSQVPLRFLQVQLDDGDCPTYQFVPGVATTSLAHLTAARLGVTREELLSLIRMNCKDADNADESSSR